jgi:hypothetical protein
MTLILPQMGFWSAAGSGFEYVGSVTMEVDDHDDWNSSGEALDVLSIAETGDLVVIALSFAVAQEPSWSWQGMAFTDVLDLTNDNNPGAYVGYRIVDAGDANPYLSGLSGLDWRALTVVASVFRGPSALVDSDGTAAGSSGMPNPASLTASAGLWVATGHLKDGDLPSESGWSAPADYTLADTAAHALGSGNWSSTAVAYRIAALSSDDPAAFGGSSSTDWAATTLAFD